LARDKAAFFFIFSAILSLLAFSLALASCTLLAWLDAATLLFCEEALFVPMACGLVFFVASLLFTTGLLFRLCPDFELVAFVLKLIIVAGSLAGVSMVGLNIEPNATEGKDAGIAVGATSESLDLWVLFIAAVSFVRLLLSLLFFVDFAGEDEEDEEDEEEGDEEDEEDEL
jgi:hypothetical protein